MTNEEFTKTVKIIDEVESLKEIFYTFFSNQSSIKQNVLVEMNKYESSINPFSDIGQEDAPSESDSDERFDITRKQPYEYSNEKLRSDGKEQEKTK